MQILKPIEFRTIQSIGLCLLNRYFPFHEVKAYFKRTNIFLHPPIINAILREFRPFLFCIKSFLLIFIRLFSNKSLRLSEKEVKVLQEIKTTLAVELHNQLAITKHRDYSYLCKNPR